MDARRNVVNCRLNDDEKSFVIKQAKSQGMEFSEYIRYKVLKEEAEFTKTKKSQCLLEENQDLIIRLIINGYLKISALANHSLSEEELEDIKSEAMEQQKKLGVEKK